MANITLFGEMINERRTIDERTAVAISEILEERMQQDEKCSGATPGMAETELRRLCVKRDRKLTGLEWNHFIDQCQLRVKPNMADAETRQMFVKIAAIAIAALRIPQE